MSKKAKLEEIETNLIALTDAALLKRDLNKMVTTLTTTLREVITVAKELADVVETTAVAKPVAAKKATPKAKAKTTATTKTRTLKKSINLDPK